MANLFLSILGKSSTSAVELFYSLSGEVQGLSDKLAAKNLRAVSTGSPRRRA